MEQDANKVIIAVAATEQWFTYGIYFPEGSEGSGGRTNMSGTCLEHTASAQDAEIQAAIRILENIYGPQPPLIIQTKQITVVQQINDVVFNLERAHIGLGYSSKSLAYLSALLERAPTKISAQHFVGRSPPAKKLAKEVHLNPPFARDWAQAECALRMEILRGLMDSQESPTSDAMVRASKLLSMAQARALVPATPAKKGKDVETAPAPAPKTNPKRMIPAQPAPYTRVTPLPKGDKKNPLPKTVDLIKCEQVWPRIVRSQRQWPSISYTKQELVLKELIALRGYTDSKGLATMDVDGDSEDGEYAPPQQGTKKRGRGVEKPKPTKKVKQADSHLFQNPLPTCILHGLTAVVDALCERIQRGTWPDPMLAVFVLYMNVDNPKPLHCLPHLVGHVGGVKIVRLGKESRKKLYGHDTYSMPQDTVFAVMDNGDVPQGLRDVIDGIEPLR